MTLWDPTQTLLNVKAALQNSAYNFNVVQIGEPMSPPTDLTVAFWLHDMEPVQVTLNDTIDVWTIMVRIYTRAGMTPQDLQSAELALALGVSQVEAALGGGFTLGGTVRAIDWVGEEQGHRVSVRWGHVVISGTIFKVADWFVPVIVDDSVQFVA